MSCTESLPMNNLLENVRQRMIRKHGNVFLKLNNCLDQEAYDQVSALIQAEMRVMDVDEGAVNAVIADLIGLGAIEVLLRDTNTSEIMINKHDEIYVERNGVISKTDLRYRDDEEVMNLIYRIVQRCGRRVNFSNPLVTASLPDGSRVHAVIPPASQYPTVTIRRFVQQVFSTDDLLASNFLSQEMLSFFETVVKGKLNIVICGATGCGKTTLLRWIAGFVPASERLITIEATRELNLNHPHCISLQESDKASIYELMVNVLHMRPDRIILGEILGAEALELLQAMGTGHDGSFTTVHTHYGKIQAINRMVRAMAKAKTVAPDELQAMITETIDLLVFVKRFSDGCRHIVEVAQVESKNGEPVFNDIFRFRKKEGVHHQVGSLSRELLDRIEDNIAGTLPDIPSLGGGSVV
ncbi:MAG: CpaF family protein [Syntrophomonadaceae bacterium]|jgi:pilus assembly protein CpaF